MIEFESGPKHSGLVHAYSAKPICRKMKLLHTKDLDIWCMYDEYQPSSVWKQVEKQILFEEIDF
jgi:hypothetical protein